MGRRRRASISSDHGIAEESTLHCRTNDQDAAGKQRVTAARRQPSSADFGDDCISIAAWDCEQFGLGVLRSLPSVRTGDPFGELALRELLFG